MYAKGGKGSAVPSDSQAREKLALYVYEYLLHVGAQKSAQTFLSEIRWEKNITLGEPPGFLHSWWCVFWDLYCAAPDRREACEHPGEAKAFQDYVSTVPAGVGTPGLCGPGGTWNLVPAQPLPLQPAPEGPVAPPQGVLHFLPPCSAGWGGRQPCSRAPSQPPVGLAGSQPLLPGAMDPSPRHPSMGGPMQRVTPPRGVASVGPQVRASGDGVNLRGCPSAVLPFTAPLLSQGYGGSMRPPPNSLAGPGLPAMNIYTVSRGEGPPGGGGPPGTPIMPSPGDSTNSSENMYTIMNPIGPGAGRANFPLGPGPEGPMAAMSAMEPHHVNGSLGEWHGSPGAVAGLSNAPGTPRDDGEMAPAPARRLLSLQYSPGMTMSV
uniref:Single stranded DNA binding protein 4 n=1 Tax=Ictidomys tridecemlineatus TaxID=43179 RepID=A0A287CYM2_ICTTR